ncbi:MAG: hypothetical protein AB7I79_15270 [Rhizobiaceae bacterium]
MRQHDGIIDALSKGDGKLVEQLCREHLVMEGQALIGVMEKEQFWS